MVQSVTFFFNPNPHCLVRNESGLKCVFKKTLTAEHLRGVLLHVGCADLLPKRTALGS
jgi:hypothetical protein